MTLEPILTDLSDRPDAFEAATAQVRSYCGWHIAPVMRETVRLSAFGGRSVLVPTRRIVEVHSVVVDGCDVTDNVDWDDAGVITLRSGSFPDRSRSVEVTLSHGYDIESVLEVASVIEQVAGRIALGREQGSDSVMQAAGPFVTRRQARLDGQVGGSGFFATEREVLNRFRLQGRLA